MKIEGIYASEQKRSPMAHRTEAVLGVRYFDAFENKWVGGGIVGDRYAKGAGSYKVKRPRQAPLSLDPIPGVCSRNLSITSIEAIDEANAILLDQDPDARPFDQFDTKRNIVISGERNLEQHIGRYIRVGTAVIFIESTCTPCNVPGEDSGKEGFEDAFAEGRGGVRAMVIQPGHITVGQSLGLAGAPADTKGYELRRKELEIEGNIWRIDGQLRDTSFPLGQPDSYISQ